jgi:hypothetical protein
LIDFESVQPKSLSLLTAEQFRVYVFIGPKNAKLPRDVVLSVHAFRGRAEYVELETAGPNALDFHLAYYLGKLVSTDPSGFFHIISKDKGFDPLVLHLKGKDVLSARSESIEEMPCFKQFAVKGDDENALSGQKKPGGAVGSLTVDDLIKIVIDDLIKRKAAKPRSQKTLKSTIHARCGRHVSAATIDAVYAALVTRGYVKVDGEKLIYELPAG